MIIQQVYKQITGATKYSFTGFKQTWQEELAFRIEVVLTIPLTIVAFWLGENALEIALLISALLLVWLIELMNTAIETTVNRISTERNPLSAKAKNQASATVFIAVFIAFIIWFSILFY